MIAPMKKVHVLTLASEKKNALDDLQQLGVLHVTPLKTPEGQDIDAIKSKLKDIEQALGALMVAQSTKKGMETPTTKPSESAEQVVADVLELLENRTALQDEKIYLNGVLNKYLPYGNIDLDSLQFLANKGVHLHLATCKAPEIDACLHSLNAQGAWYEQFGEHNGEVYFAVIGDNTGLEVEHFQILDQPPYSIAATKQKVQAVDTQELAIQAKLLELSLFVDDLQAWQNQLASQLQWEEAGAGMIGSEDITAIAGFIPESSIAAVQEQAKRSGWALQIEEPSAEEAVPTLLQQPPWVRPINTLFDMIGVLPGYKEIDISAVFLLFFSLFFAMIVGDAGYGMVFLGLTVFFAKKLKNAPRQAFLFLGIMSVTTIIWGTFSASWFGINFETLPAVLQNLRIPWLANSDNVQNLCFLIGSIHLSVAHLWNIWLKKRTLQALGQLGWLMTTWTMFFLANQMVLGKEFPPIMWNIFMVGVGLIFLFNIPFKEMKARWVDMVMLPLNLVTNFVDVVSYIRLFAVGAASFAVANSFNEMLSPMLGSWGSGLIAAVFLFFAHGLNITLALMGVLVHGVRLNTLEYSNHMGLEWSGVAYEPFTKRENR